MSPRKHRFALTADTIALLFHTVYSQWS